MYIWREKLTHRTVLSGRGDHQEVCAHTQEVCVIISTQHLAVVGLEEDQRGVQCGLHRPQRWSMPGV